MGRPWREEYTGAIYHVIARGNNKEYIFKESIDKGYFIKLLKESMTGMCFRIYGYVLMDNHYHIVLQVLDKKLQKIMHQINNKYSKYFNYKYKRVGHVFQGRYKSMLVQDERYLVSLIRYLHQNPIKAGMCHIMEEYKWSSDIFYRTGNNSFVSVDVILDMLSKDRRKAISRYKEYMEQEEQRDYDSINIVGEEGYQMMYSIRKGVEARKRLDEILIEQGMSKEKYELIKNGSRRRDLTIYKINYLNGALKMNYTYKEAGANIGISESAVRSLINRA